MFLLEDALKAVAIRGKLVQALPAGAMLAVLMEEADLTQRLSNSELDIAAVNYPELCVVAGELEAIQAFQYELEEEGIFCKHLDTSHGFHSSMMDPMLPAFKDVIDGIELNAPQIPFISTVSGQWISDELVHDSDYWVRHVRNPVLFSHAFKTLIADYQDGFVALEIGPGRLLNLLLSSTFEKKMVQMPISYRLCLRRKKWTFPANISPQCSACCGRMALRLTGQLTMAMSVAAACLCQDTHSSVMNSNCLSSKLVMLIANQSIVQKRD